MLRSFFHRLGATRPASAPRPSPSIPKPSALSVLAPDEPLCLVGDLHGRADLLDRLMRLHASHFPQARLVFLGDMIDRGPDSASVLARLRAEEEKGAICLAGNHEAMFLSFLDQPENGLSWLKHGGLEMVESYGLTLSGAAPEMLVELRDALRARMPEGLESWLRGLRSYWQSGNVVAVHAALDPDLPLHLQTPKVLQWGHKGFGREPRADGLWVAHGHVVVEQAFASKGRIALDTGAYATGKLSFAMIDPALPPEERLTLAITP